MGTRTYMYAMKSLQPIQAIIGSKNATFLDDLLSSISDPKQYLVYPPEANERFLVLAREMIMNPPPPVEPGAWCYLLERVAELLDLAPMALPLDEWKHYFVWEEYRSVAEPSISRTARGLLELLEFGRPLQGESIDVDAGAFSWLSATEASLLFGEIESLDGSSFGELEDFHAELVESLKVAADKQLAMPLTAC